jgi:hypothetical protein
MIDFILQFFVCVFVLGGVMLYLWKDMPEWEKTMMKYGGLHEL